MLAHLPRGAAQLDVLCARGNADPVTERLCARTAIRGLADLQRVVGVAIVDPTRGNGEGGNASFALLAHSTSISARLVSPINPRAFLFTSPATIARVRGPARPDPAFVAMGFSRGEQLVELVARDRRTGALRFFLVRFEQACNAGSCTPADLFTPAIERDWTAVDVYEDRDLANTVLDCAVCHQPGGPGTPKMLRMQELQEPWTHFLRAVDDGKALLGAYRAAHDVAEPYAGIPGFIIGHSQPARLQGLVEHEGFRAQPSEFPTQAIVLELGGGRAPERSRAWTPLLDGVLAGRAIPVPPPMAMTADPRKLAEATAGYRRVMRGASDLPPMADLHREDARWMSSLRPKPGLDAPAMLRQMCARCHNPALDQTVSRALFDATRVEAMSRREKDEVIRRLRLPASSPKKMPPPRFGELAAEEIETVVAHLAQ